MRTETRSVKMTDKTKISEIYDGLVNNYLDRDTPSHRAFLNTVELQELAKLDMNGKSLLDIGCGVGRVAAFVQGKGIGFYCGVDISIEMIAACQHRFKGYEELIFQVGDASCLALPDESFDIIVCYGLYEYIDNLSSYLSEASRLLAKGGRFIFTVHTCFGAALYNRRFGQYRRVGWHTEEIIAEVYKAGFRLESARPQFSYLSRVRGIVQRMIPGESFQRSVMAYLATLDGFLSRIVPNSVVSYALACTHQTNSS